MSEEQGLAFRIGGREYPSPDLDSLTMLERRVMYDLCGIIQEDFAPQDDETETEHDERVGKLTRHPGFLESLMHIAYQREHPELSRAKVEAVIGSTNYLEALEAWTDSAEEADVIPLALTSPPDEPSSSLTDSKPERSGPSSTTGTDEPADALSHTGTLRWGTSPMSAPETLRT